jgi:5-methylcytosine-specific restriction endonuclease McrA
MPLARVCWQDALSMVVTGRVEVLEEYEDRLVHSAYRVFNVPSVVRFIKTVTGFFKRGVKFNRRNIWLRDKGRCQYCGDAVTLSGFTFDHVIPRKEGGKTVWENIVVCCRDCNQRKRDRTPERAGMTLRVKPQRPKSLPREDFTKAWGGDIPQSWKDYIGTVQYWHGRLSET